MGAPMHMTADKPEPEPVMVDRYTRSGRRLFYRLQVIQQPERARACGSGPKSSADRRPVDPPPVVELRIFEGPTFEESKDITFNYNANFFLYATLEHARLIAHGRVQTPAANTPPVLTGMPVSAMAYLDRPQEAGYFLFPDLSVRHEGRYRLTFTLYEETKEDKDKDADNVDPVPFQSSFDWRMDVKSVDFTVYSAKKFPGLSESTTLSRTVAEQGCRVRIRRDVRMRRRDDKPGADGESRKDEFARSRRRTQTPEVQREFRPRSLSNSSERTPYPSEPSRRPSGVEFSAPAGPPPPPPPPGFPSSQTSSTSHLTFGGGSFTNPPQYPSQASSSGHASPVPRSPSFAGGQSGYPPTSHLSSQPAAGSQTPAYPERPPSQQCTYPNRSPRREEMSADVRRLSSTSQVFRPNTPQSATDREFGPKSQYPTGPLQPAAPIASLEARDGPSRILPPFSTFITCENNGASDVGPRPLSQLLSPTSDQSHRGSISMRELVPPGPPQMMSISRKRPHSEANPHGYYYQPESKNGKRPEESVMYQRMQERSGLLEERCLQYESADYTPRSALWQKFV